MFNIGPGELVAILAVALIVLGPTRLPDAVRTVGRVVGELRRISSGFQDELRNAFDDSDVIDQLEKGPSAKPVPSADAGPTDAGSTGEATDTEEEATDADTDIEAIDTAALGLSGVTASTELAGGAEHSDDDLDGDGTDDVNDRDHSDEVDTTLDSGGTDGAGEPGTEDPPETDQRAAS